MRDLDLLFAGNAVTFAYAVRDRLLIQAAANMAKAQMTDHARMLRRMTHKQIISYEEGSNRSRSVGSIGDVVVGRKRYGPLGPRVGSSS